MDVFFVTTMSFMIHNENQDKLKCYFLLETAFISFSLLYLITLNVRDVTK